MKRKILSVLLTTLIVVFGCGSGMAGQSETKTGDALIVRGQGSFLGIILVTDGANAVTLNIYDNYTASGKKLIPTDTVITTSATDRIQAIGFSAKDVNYYKGIYVDITCVGTVSYMIYYDPR